MTDEFDTFWSAFPRKIAKGDARKAWNQTDKIRPSLEIILSAIASAKKTEQWNRDRGQFIPYPATWLRAERWDDVHEVEIAASDAVDSTQAWSTLRECIRANKEPPAAIKAACSAIGGFWRLCEMDSKAIDFKQREFEQAYRQGSH